MECRKVWFGTCLTIAYFVSFNAYYLQSQLANKHKQPLPNNTSRSQSETPSTPPGFSSDKRRDTRKRGSVTMGVAVWSGWKGSDLHINMCHEGCNGNVVVAERNDNKSENLQFNHSRHTHEENVQVQQPSSVDRKSSLYASHKTQTPTVTFHSSDLTVNSSARYCLSNYINTSELTTNNNAFSSSPYVDAFQNLNVNITASGIVLSIINQRNARLIMQKVFPLGEYWAHWADFNWYMQRISPGRIVVVSVSQHGCSGLRKAILELAALGSAFAQHLTPYAHWSWIFIKGGRTISETVTLQGFVDNHQHAVVPLNQDPTTFKPTDDPLERIRWHYCAQTGAMGDLCDEYNPMVLPTPSLPSLSESAKDILKDIPVVVTAGNRPQYLYRTITSLLASPGVIPENIFVVLGETASEPKQLLCLLNINFTVLQTEGNHNVKLFRYYRSVYDLVANYFPFAPAAIFLDEDVEVSPDFFSFMSKTMWLLQADLTLYCINGFSATGFNGYAHDPSTVLRGRVQVEWGYALTMDFIKEALSKWPLDPGEADTLFYDQWLYRHASSERECIFPEVSRTYHFGMGVNTDAFSTEAYFQSMPTVSTYNQHLHDLNRLIYGQYQIHFSQMIQNAIPLTGNPCKDDFIPPVSRPTSFVFYYKLDRDAKGQRVYYNYFYTAKCLGVWAMSEQGQHDLVMTVRASINTTLYLVGAPDSPYGHLCPTNIKPWNVDDITDEENDILLDKIRKLELGNYFIPNQNMTSDMLIETMAGN